MYTTDKKEKAIAMRKEGYTYSHISKQVSVAKSTLSLWLQGISFIPNELTKYSMRKGQKYNADIKRADKASSLKKAEEYAQKYATKLSDNELFLLGIGIYIGEGSKTGHITRVVNSDPRIVRFSIEWFKRCFKASESNFRVRIHIYPDNDPDELIRFWMKELSLRRSCFQEPYIDRRLNKKSKKRKVLPYGTAHLTVNSNGNKDLGALLHRKIIATIDRVLEIGSR